MSQDEFDDDPWNEEMERDYKPSATSLAAQPLIVTNTQSKPDTGLTKDEQRAIERDAPLWSDELPDTKTEAKFWGNLALRLVRGITPQEIRKMSVRDRFSASTAAFEKKRLLEDKPTANINFQARQSIPDVLNKVQEELARRKRERETIDITPTESA